MRNSNNGALKSFFMFLFGFIFAFVAIGAGGFIAYKTLKMKTINNLIGTDIVGKGEIDGVEYDLPGMNLGEMISFIGDLQSGIKTLTIENMEKLFPVFQFGDTFSSFVSEDGQNFVVPYKGNNFISIDLNKFKTTPINKMGSLFTSYISNDLTLGQVEDFNIGVSLSNSLPFVKGVSKDDSTPISSYIKLTKPVKDRYTQDAENIYYLKDDGDWETADAEMYTDETTVLYYKTQGLLDIPFEDAMKGIADTLDLKEMTLEDMELKFNVNFGDNRFMTALRIRKYTKEEALAAGKAEGEIMYDKNGNPVKTKVLEISSQIDYLTIKDVINASTATSEFMTKVLDSIGDEMLFNMANAMESMRVVDILNFDRDAKDEPTGVMYYLLYNSDTGAVNEELMIKDLSDAMTRAASNIANDTIGNLIDKGILKLPGADDDLKEYTLNDILTKINAEWSNIKHLFTN